MSDLTDPKEPSFEDEVHDLLLANYIQSRRILDLLYILVHQGSVATADAVLARHKNNDFFYPDVFETPDE